MGSTTNPRPNTDCPNCHEASNEMVGLKDESGVGIFECHNETCSVGRFWGTDSENDY